jgi:hypothetical protein
MNNLSKTSVLIGTFSLCCASVMADPAQQVEQAVMNGGRASGNAAASAGHSLSAMGQLASGVAATPMLASGAIAVSVGSAAVGAGGSLMNAANNPIGTPLPLTEETISIMPPNKALQKSTAKN